VTVRCAGRDDVQESRRKIRRDSWVTGLGGN
jgi:hypothetical protein